MNTLPTNVRHAHFRLGDLIVLGIKHTVEAEKSRKGFPEVLQMNVLTELLGVRTEVHDVVQGS